MTTYPVISVEHWGLTILRANAEREVLRLDDLMALPSVEREATISTASAPSNEPHMATARWRGTRLSQLFPRNSSNLTIMAANGKLTHLPAIAVETALLAYEINGQLLPPEQGSPLRLIVPGADEVLMPGWVRRIEVAPNASHDNTLPQPAVSAMILRPASPVVVDEPVTLWGYAFAGLSSIDQVSISIDGSPMQPIPHIEGEPGVWSRWGCQWIPNSIGELRVRVRIEAQGRVGEASSTILVEAVPR